MRLTVILLLQVQYRRLECMLKALFQDFNKVLLTRRETGPQAIFVLRFIEELALKAPTPWLLYFLPLEIVSVIVISYFILPSSDVRNESFRITV